MMKAFDNFNSRCTSNRCSKDKVRESKMVTSFRRCLTVTKRKPPTLNSRSIVAVKKLKTRESKKI